jgi:hypothetical protein
VRFPMADGIMTVTVLVTRDVLDAIDIAARPRWGALAIACSATATGSKTLPASNTTAAGAKWTVAFASPRLTSPSLSPPSTRGAAKESRT